jgi:hypothetical protein
MTQKSLFVPSLQEPNEANAKYIPTSLFRNISYGKIALTNNYHAYLLFQGKIIYGKNSHEILVKGIDFQKGPDREKKTQELMEYLRDNHTYINRVQSIQQFIREYTLYVL